MLTKAREGDHIIIKKLDRLGRNTADMLKIINDIQERGITIQFLDDGISTDGSMGKLVMTILAAVAEAERERIMERTREGRRQAITNGVKMGRKIKLTEDQIIKIRKELSDNIPKTRVAQIHGIRRQSLYNLIKA